MSLISTALLLRGDARLLKLPPYLSFLCVVVGIAWLLMLPMKDYSRGTYISENALLPGQVHTYFAGSDQNVFRAYKHEVDALIEHNNTVINDQLEGFFQSAGLKVARQTFEYTSLGVKYGGENVYAILNAPRGDATEAIVLVGAWKTIKGELNRSGVALVLTLARYFKRWSLWSKDIIFLVTPDSRAGPQAWVDAYHDAHDTYRVSSLPLKSGALQGALAIDFPFDHRFESLHIVYDGVNGQLPNLDLFNTIVSIASGQMGISVSLQQMWKHTDEYRSRLTTMLRGMLSQGLGHASGPHSSFIPYHIDAVTLQPYGEGWQDEMAMGRVIESTFRSLNNLLEHLHQSFFFYLLMQANRFVSIGTYLPSAMLVAGSFTIMSIYLWVQSGRVHDLDGRTVGKPSIVIDHKEGQALVSPEAVKIRERQLFLPLVVVGGAHFLGLIPLYFFNHARETLLPFAVAVFAVLNLLLPYLVNKLIAATFNPTIQQYELMKSFSLLLLGMFLSSLATLNFSLALLIGLLATPLSHVQPMQGKPLHVAIATLLLNLFAPTSIFCAACRYLGVGVSQALRDAAFGWNVSGLTTQIVIWCVWWPAWLIGATSILGKPAA